MKKNIFFFAAIVALASCTITKRHYAPGYHVQCKSFREFSPTEHWQNQVVLTSRGRTEKDLEASSSSITQAELAASQYCIEELNFANPFFTKIKRDYEIDDDADALETFGANPPEAEKEEMVPQFKWKEMASDTIDDHFPDQRDLSANKKLNQKALWGMILSIVGLPTVTITLIGVLLCGFALDEIKEHGGRGKILAKIGIVIPLIIVGSIVLYVVGFLIYYIASIGIS